MMEDYVDYNEVRRLIDKEREQLQERFELMNGLYRTLEKAEKAIAENATLKEENEALRLQLQEREMQLNEMTKLSASVAGKTSQDELHKALRVFVNKSKRKKIEKRIAIKEMVLELANANGAVLPEDLAATIDSLDDEQSVIGPMTIQVAAGGINVQQANHVGI